MITARHKCKNLGVIDKTVGADDPKLAKLDRKVEKKRKSIVNLEINGEITR